MKYSAVIQTKKYGSLFFILLLLAFAGGCIALGHQLLWTRRMVDIIGGSAESLSRVIGSFFLGLTLGAALAGLCLRRYSPLLFLGWMELGVALGSLPLLFLPSIMSVLWMWLGEAAWQTHWGGWVKLVISFTSVLVPAVFMGFFLPFALQILKSIGRTMERDGLWLYAINTVGGVAGIWMVLFLFVPTLGVAQGLLFFISLNVGLSLLFFLLHRKYGKLFAVAGESNHLPSAGPGSSEIVSAPSQSYSGFIFLASLSFFSGLALLAAEVSMMEMLLLIAPISYVAPGIILALILFCLAVAAACGAWWFQVSESKRDQRLWYLLVATGLFTLLAPILFHTLAKSIGGFPPQPNYTTFVLKLSLVTTLSCGPALFFAGLLFPWITASLGQSTQRSKESKWAYLLALNGLGGFLGAEMSYRWLMPWLGLHAFIGLVAVGYLVVALFVSARLLQKSSVLHKKTGLGIMILALSILVLQKVHVTLPVINERIGWEVLEQRTGREGTVVAVEDAQGHRGIIVSNQYLLASSRARWRQERQAHIPLLLHPNPGTVAFIGMATGMTPSGALLHPEVERVVGFELSEDVARLARKYFSSYTYGLFGDPRFEHIVEDGRLGMAAAPDTFDVIVSDLFLPWGVGAGRLYSQEHFELVYRSLREGGVFFQWLPMHQLTEKEVLIILATFHQVFPSVGAFTDGFESAAPSLALVGWKNGPEEVDLSTLEKRMEELRRAGLIRDPLMRWPEALFLLDLGSFPEVILSNGEINTLNSPGVERSAARGRSVLRPDHPYLNGAYWRAFLQRNLPESSQGDKDFMDKSRRVGRDFIHINAEAEGDLRSRALHEIVHWFPEKIFEDEGADWDRWPGETLLPVK